MKMVASMVSFRQSKLLTSCLLRVHALQEEEGELHDFIPGQDGEVIALECVMPGGR